MSTGISISSINQIKELAEEKRYAEALEVLDTQNLDKSINPQFLRISGEIFRKNKRYYDSRRILIKAHQMSPQGTRIISELIQLYLELGYFSLANQYYEEYKFYVGSEDTQKEFVEYIVKKANGADIKELASIVIPILERMPEDQWNYEAMLLYDKMDRKDKALDEARFILENYRNSIYVDRVISYIDDKLDVDAEFFVYPKEEQTEDEATYGDLILLEQSILKKDHLAMYPPEARIMVEVDDRDGFDAKPVKEKKEKKPKKKKIRKEKTSSEESETAKEENISDTTGSEADEKDEVASSEGQEVTSEADPVSESEAVLSSEEDKTTEQPEASPSESAKQTEEDVTKDETSDETSDEPAEEKEPESDEEILQKQRNEALEKLLSKKIDTDAVKESAKQLADSIKGIDTAKAKSQVKMVTSTVVDNVKKASDALGDAVGTKPVMESVIQQDIDNKTEEIVDGIIEDVLEPPKQTVGQVVLNEELDALVPDSLEAMSTDEIADIEARKEEQERLELEALEAALKLEEEKRNKKFWSKNQETEEEPEESSYSKLKNLYMEEYMPKEEEIQSLGFVTVVHSDVDGNIETELPDTAQMLRQMIDNKEYYADENSLGFESEESYHNHGFEVEEYEKQEDLKSENPIFVKQPYNSDVYKVEDIYVDTSILSFDDMVPEVVIPIENYKQSDDWTHLSSDADEEKNMEETPEFEIETFEIETFEETLEESLDSDFPESEEAVEEEDEIAVAIDETTVEEETDTKETEVEAAIVEETNAEKADVEVNSVVTESVEEITQEEETATEVDLLNPVEDIRRDRMSLRARIVITESMEQKLSVLKETK